MLHRESRLHYKKEHDMKKELQKRVDELGKRAKNFYDIWVERRTVDNFHRWINANNEFVAEWNHLKKEEKKVSS